MVNLSAVPAGAATKHSHLRDMGVPTMFGAFVLLVSATMLLGANVSALHGNLQSMDHSQQVLNRISEVETGLLGDELIVRGYALTGDASFLRVQKSGGHGRSIAWTDLTRLMAIEPQRATQFRQVTQDVTRHIEIFGKLSGIGPDRAQIVARAILDRAVRANMRQTRTGLAALRTAELGDLASRQRDITNQLYRAFFLAIGIIVVAFLLGGIGVWAAQIKAPKR